MRDLDVQLENLADMSLSAADLGLGSDHHGGDPLAVLAALLERERDAARAVMLQGLDSVRWDRLAKGLTVMVQQGPARRSLATRVAGRHRLARTGARTATRRSPRQPSGPSGPGS